MFYTIHDTDVLLCCCCSIVSCIWLFAAPWTAAHHVSVLHYLQELAQVHIHWIIQYITQIYYCHLILRTHSSVTDYLNNFFLLKRFNSEACSGWASQVTLVVKNLPANAQDIRDVGLTPGSGRSPGEGHGNLLQCSCLENSMDRGVGGLQSMGSQRVRHDWATKQQQQDRDCKSKDTASQKLLEKSWKRILPRASRRNQSCPL